MTLSFLDYHYPRASTSLPGRTHARGQQDARKSSPPISERSAPLERSEASVAPRRSAVILRFSR